VIYELVDAFNNETQDGQDMSFYSDTLKQVIADVI
jgi:hypothetical protein